ncbi:hypothetical protein EYF80_028427 [Liparis tanakae]|uniref:Uncharacterized protein n=1 Tax=Liparis tanakae TaxID=230148 RepID=A0A4Z2H7D7_9TELE|nr:hypothetical protein EYF80_028427 [Liparis tanakae]
MDPDERNGKRKIRGAKRNPRALRAAAAVGPSSRVTRIAAMVHLPPESRDLNRAIYGSRRLNSASEGPAISAGSRRSNVLLLLSGPGLW